MLDDLMKKFKRDNDVGAEPEHSPYVNIEGLEKEISVPAPTKEDKRWARKIKNATTADVAKALISTIEMGQNWRVWYLVNRPLRTTRNLLGRIKNLGFEGNTQVNDGLSKAAEKNNVTAAYLLLKFAEKNQTSCLGTEDAAREELEHYARRNLLTLAEKPGTGVFILMAQTMATLAESHTFMHQAEQQMMLMQASIAAAGAGNTAHLDALLDTGLLEPRKFVDAFMLSFQYKDVFGGEKDATPEMRERMLDWLKSRGIVDETFAEEAAAVEVRVAGQKETLRQSLGKGWKQSERWLPDEDGKIAPPGAAAAEITVPDIARQSITYVFNFNANRAHKICGEIAHAITLDQAPQALLDEARNFVDAAKVRTPEIVWEKGAPFRLRINQPKT